MKTYREAKARELAHIYLDAPNLEERLAAEKEARKAGVWRMVRGYIVAHLFGKF